MTYQVSVQAIYELTQQVLQKQGAASWVAEAVAEAVSVAEAKGNKICGLYYLESYCLQLKSGRVKGDVEPEVTQPKPSAVYVNARHGFAQAAFQKGLPLALESAKKQGVCAFSIAHAHTCTSLGFFTEQIARAGFIALGFTNASAVVAPPNGCKAVIGTNPIAMAVPDNEGGIALQFDQSTSAVALGKITQAKAAGEKIPLGWALDKHGQPTDDPDAALEGTLCSSGGYKGWGFGLMAEILASALTGSVASSDVKALKSPDGKPHDLGQFYVLIDPQMHVADAFWQRLQQLERAVDGQDPARLPGSRPVIQQTVTIDKVLWDHLKTYLR